MLDDHNLFYGVYGFTFISYYGFLCLYAMFSYLSSMYYYSAIMSMLFKTTALFMFLFSTITASWAALLV